MSTYTALLYNETNLLSLLLLVIVLLKLVHSNDIRMKLPSFMGFVISLIILTVGDMFWAFVNSDIILFTRFWGYFTNMVYFVGTLASVYYLFMLYQDVLGYNGDYVKKSLLIAIPFVADIIFVLLTPWTHLVFLYEGDVYHRAEFYTLALCIPYAFVIYLCIASLIQSFMPKYFIIRRSLRIMTRYSLMTLSLSFVQLISGNVLAAIQSNNPASAPAADVSANFPLYVVGGALICLLMYIDSLNDLHTVDPITRLQNRRALENHLSALTEKGCDEEKNIYLIMTDLVDFKAINDIYGREEGDEVLRKAAQLVRRSVPTSWMLARFGGDEFAAAGVCNQLEVDAICTQIANSFEDYNLASAKPYTVMLSTSYAAFSAHCKNVNDLIHLAENRLEQSKIMDKAGYPAPAGAEGHATARSGLQTTEEPSPISQQDINLWMYEALKNGEFVPYFQPQINLQDGTISGAEALARWIHPERGMIYPSLFIPVFERNGFIYEMDKAIWHGTCALIRRWKDQGLQVPPVSVNVSRWDIVQNDFIQVLQADLQEFGLQSADLHLEITESAYLFDQEALVKLMEKLQGMGFEIEMDDFGSGYSSLTAFKDLPFNLLKLDASLIRESTKTEKAKSILKGIIRLANGMDMPMIAEGIEYKEQADLLKGAGCYHMQGYLFAKPMPPEKFVEFLQEWNKDAIRNGAAV